LSPLAGKSTRLEQHCSEHQQPPIGPPGRSGRSLPPPPGDAPSRSPFGGGMVLCCVDGGPSCPRILRQSPIRRDGTCCGLVRSQPYAAGRTGARSRRVPTRCHLHAPLVIPGQCVPLQAPAPCRMCAGCTARREACRWPPLTRFKFANPGPSPNSDPHR
jgi:hypothetical protein